MLFNSLEFVIFLPIVVMIYFALPYRWRWVFLLAASYYFYMSWKPEYALLIIISTLIDYYASIQMGKKALRSEKTRYLVISLICNLGLLFAFKYFNLFNDTARAVFNSFNVFYDVPAFDMLLPVGISFYTFQTMSYTIDVYMGKTEPEKHLGIFALYVSFFPQLVAGPIERSTNLLPQMYQKFDFEYGRVVSGLQLIVWGFFKKVVIADTLGVYVNAVYNSPGEHYGLPVILATYFFAFQIYCDFSGYSDIAIGSAQIMGYDLMENFRRPYFSSSISEFWKRWHISLSTWFRDYLYIPLGGNRVSKPRWYFNLFIVFLVSGLWHGANWTFVVWGALHGAYLVCSLWTGGIRMKLVQLFGLNRLPTVHRYLQIFMTFHLVLLGWIFFRANSVSDAFLLLTNMFHIELLHINPAQLGIDVADGMGTEELTIAFFSVLFLIAVHILEERKGSIRTIISSKPFVFRWALYITLVLSILNLGMPQEIPFIYFQF